MNFVVLCNMVVHFFAVADDQGNIIMEILLFIYFCDIPCWKWELLGSVWTRKESIRKESMRKD